jgi:hypothetical protein
MVLKQTLCTAADDSRATPNLHHEGFAPRPRLCAVRSLQVVQSRASQRYWVSERLANHCRDLAAAQDEKPTLLAISISTRLIPGFCLAIRILQVSQVAERSENRLRFKFQRACEPVQRSFKGRRIASFCRSRDQARQATEESGGNIASKLSDFSLEHRHGPKSPQALQETT